MPKGIPKNGKRNYANCKTLTYNGMTMTISAWTELLGFGHSTIRERIKKGWNIEDVLCPDRWHDPNRAEATSYKVAKDANGKAKGAHVVVAENVLGKPLPSGAIVHHVDGNMRNNSNDNLVICPDRAYHNMLHARQRALDATGDANKRKCTICGEYDDAENMYVNRTARHRECHLAYERNRRART